jgi:hypothetical protein
VKSLEGTWEFVGGNGERGLTEIKVSSAGSAVREIMFSGSKEEMTNMYHLDGNALVMTHYCAAGNQPRLIATKKVGNTLAFHADSVSDLKATDKLYMGEMTLEVVDHDHMIQKWHSLGGDGKSPAENVTITYTRRS